VQNIFLAIPVLLFSMVAHEYAHGYAALREGDNTALMLGRLTFNPIKHIDPWMTILLPALLWFGSGGRMMFGGAKPVPVNPRNFRNYKRGDVIVSAAGIVVNLMLSVVFLGLSIGIGMVGKSLGTGGQVLGILQWMTLIGIWFNLLLAFFNLIPIPPLDGSHLFYHLLPPQLGARYRALSGYGLLILPLLLFVVPEVFSILLYPARALFTAALRLAIPYTLQGLPSF
jgi:Zn-dependent protease